MNIVTLGERVRLGVVESLASERAVRVASTYTVVRGDTLWDIAVRFYGNGQSFRQIAEANGIRNPDRIFAGQVLTIPDLAPPPGPPPAPPEPSPAPAPAPAPAEPPTPPEPIAFRILRPTDLVDLQCEAIGFRLSARGAPAVTPVPSPPPPPVPVTYEVVKGDTLWDIAGRFYGDRRRFPEIAAANNIPNPDRIFPGQVLLIPGLFRPPPPTPADPAAPAAPWLRYMVVRGDTLWDIAARFYGDSRRFPEIAAANRIADPDRIFPGQVLVIPGVADPAPPGATAPGPEPVDDRRYLVAEDAEALVVVRFASQNLYEERYPPGADVTTLPTARVRAAGESRLVFRAPTGTRIEFSTAGVLRALATLPLKVSESAAPVAEPGGPPPEPMPPEPAPPTEHETAIEAPFRLVVSPSGRGAFVHDAEETSAPGDPTRVELWSTRLSVRTEAGDEGHHDDTDDTQRIVRALLARDDAEGTQPPFEGSLGRNDREAIVRQTSRHTEGDVEPEPLSVRKLYLSTLGAWIDWSADWSHGPGTPEIADYQHLATMGRDCYVRVARPGILFPVGHAAVLVTVTERRLSHDPDPVARLFERQFIVLHETVRSSTARDLPFVSVTLGPVETPELATVDDDDPAPFVPRTTAGTDFFWEITGTDHAAGTSRIRTPLVFVPTPRQPETTDVGTLRASTLAAWDPHKRLNVGGQDVAMAPVSAASAGATTVRVEDLTLGGALDLGPSGRPTCVPTMTSASVSIPALAAFNRGGQPTPVTYDARYAAEGFVEDDPAQVFLQITAPRVLNFGGDSAGSGGFVQPNVGVQALSRTLGAIGDKNVAPDSPLGRGKFDPQAFLGNAGPKLFGLFSLLDLLTALGAEFPLDKAPSLVGEALAPLASLGAELARLLEALDRASAELARAGQNAATLTMRADAARGELAGAADPLAAAFEDILAGRPADAAAQAELFRTKLARLDDVVADPGLPAFARAELEKPLGALRGVAALAADPNLAAALQAVAAGVLRFDWRPDIGPFPKDKPVFTPRRDGLTISVEARPADKPGQQPTVDVSAQLAAFELALIPDVPMMSLSFTRIGFRTTTGRKPEIDVVFDRMRFEGVLGFIEKLRQVIPFDGFADPPYVDISPAGVRAGFDLALPSVAVGVFTMENISLSADCRVPFLGDAVTVGFGFCLKDAPFRLTVSAIGGGGWVGIRLSPRGLTVLEMGLEAGACLSVDLGVASGSVSVMIGVYLRLEGDGGQLTGYFRIRGEVDVLGLASASITLELSLTYDFDTGKLVGRASLRLEVEVLFFSASVEVSVERRLAGSNGDPKLIDVMPPDRGGQAMWESYFDAFALGA